MIASSSDAGAPTPIDLPGPALIDTGVWSWVRDRRFPGLADWFNAAAAAGHVLVCDLVAVELIRQSASPSAARERAKELGGFELLPMPETLWKRVRELQAALAANGDHRRVPPADLLIAATAEHHQVPLVHHDADYPVIAEISELRQEWFVPQGSLAA